jgi:multidrug efflux pump subunit AcrA (membrane-fusion protein)
MRPEADVVPIEKRTIVRTTGQPGFIEAYEQTAIYPKIAGFVDKWNFDIGSLINRGMVLAHLDVPDLVAKYEEAKAEVELDEVRIEVAKKLVNVAIENYKTAQAQVEQAKADLGKYRADVARWKTDYDRISALRKKDAVDQVVEDESRKHWLSSIASLEAAESGVVVAQATEAARRTDVEKARIDVDASQAQLKVARAAERRLAAMVGYTFIEAPYDGIVVMRNVNTGDFAQPAAGDPSAQGNNPGGSRTTSNPLYVVARTDKVRIFLDVPEFEANGIQPGSRAHVTIQAVDNMKFAAEVTRTSWSLSPKARTLRAEIDIPNPIALNSVDTRSPKGTLSVLGASILGMMDSPLGTGPVLAATSLFAGRPYRGRILPNMYAYGSVELKRADVWAIPLQSVFQLGNQSYCYLFEDGKAVQLAVQLGIDDGNWVEVARKRDKNSWVPCNGSERILVGELSQLSNGEPVRVTGN